MRKKIRKNNNSEDNHDQPGYLEIASNDYDEDQFEYACNLDSKVQ